MTTRRDFNARPPEPVRLAWCDWFRHHTIDPDKVVANDGDGGFVEIDPNARQIRYLAYNVNDNGNRFMAADGNGASRSVRVMQLESVPSPFPDVCS